MNELRVPDRWKEMLIPDANGPVPSQRDLAQRYGVLCADNPSQKWIDCMRNNPVEISVANYEALVKDAFGNRVEGMRSRDFISGCAKNIIQGEYFSNEVVEAVKQIGVENFDESTGDLSVVGLAAAVRRVSFLEGMTNRRGEDIWLQADSLTESTPIHYRDRVMDQNYTWFKIG